MTTKRAAVDEVGDGNQNKRRRSVEEDTFPPSLDDINDDCVLLILKHLPVDDLNSVAICGRRYQEARSHESLDQTRAGTIVFTEHTSLESICNAFVAQEWSRVFTGNRTHMKVVGVERVPDVGHHAPERTYHFWLPNVTSLDMSFNSLATNRNVQSAFNVRMFVGMLLNLEEIDLSNLLLPPDRSRVVLSNTILACRKIRRLCWNGSQEQVFMDGSFYSRSTGDTLTELFLDGSLLGLLVGFTRERYSVEEADQDGQNYYLFKGACHLERLSIKNVTWPCHVHYHPDAERVPQEVLIKMVRHHPTLRWLRSDLTEENIARLQRERPDITFVSE